MSGKGAPPPLPPRQPSTAQYAHFPTISTPDDDGIVPPPYDSVYDEPSVNHLWTSHDSRASSTQSLLPVESHERAGRRKLLLVYIHGFMGNETSFRSFPAHVHHLLVVLLAETHIVHSKIYPRYRSKRNIRFARDDFSRWLEPHEDALTDVVMLGHSMGGLLSAEVVLMPTSPSGGAFKHRILGTINLDVPFLGMHPGVVKSGLASIFSSPDAPQDARAEVSSGTTGAASPASSNSVWDPDQQDPNFNPAFPNDQVLPVRTGWRSAWHFVSKHSDDLIQASKKLVTSHMEFGGAMANYSELKTRYTRLRALEVDDEQVRLSVADGAPVPSRVRFVNYYTASTGRPKRPKGPTQPADASDNTNMSDGMNRAFADELDQTAEDNLNTAAETLTIGPQGSAGGAHNQAHSTTEQGNGLEGLHSAPSFWEIPELPPAPPALDVSYIEDAETRRLVEKEHAHALKAYEQAIRDREKVIGNRTRQEGGQAYEPPRDAIDAGQAWQVPGTQASQADRMAEDHTEKQNKTKMTHRQREETRLEKERQRMEAEARRMQGGQTSGDRLQDSAVDRAKPNQHAAIDTVASTHSIDPEISVPMSTVPEQHEIQAPAKERTFCTLPPKDSNGQRDPCWVRVLMKGVDEVGAHCGLFFVDERYERLVGEVAERIEQWVGEDLHEFDLD